MIAKRVFRLHPRLTDQILSCSFLEYEEKTYETYYLYLFNLDGVERRDAVLHLFPNYNTGSVWPITSRIRIPFYGGKHVS